MSDDAIGNDGENTLSRAFNNILPSCDRIDALVGYFFFSGFREIYEEVVDKHIRILVGLEIDQGILNRLSLIDQTQLDAGHLVATEISSKTLAKQRYYEQFAAMFNNTDQFDTDRDVKAFKIFLKKIEDGTLEIRKTSTPQHGKFYIFTFNQKFTQGGMNKGVVIEGSSNLTRNGLMGQGEHNRLLKEDHYYQGDVKKFETLWADANNIIIADKNHADEFTKEVKKRLWLFAQPSPYLVYLRMLDEYFGSQEVEHSRTPSSISGGKYTDLQYQIDAVNLGIDRINKFGGVIIADVVGLGKSIIASAIAHNLKLKTVVIVPPHLIDQWEDYRTDFNFNARVFSTGKIEEALGKFGDSKEELLIILDEAHKHRNEDTTNYELLHRLCAGNKVMALSATPFNNDPKDIYALIKLFDTPGQSTLRTVENLSMEFHALISEYKKLRSQIRSNKDASTDSPEAQKLTQKGAEIARKLRSMIEPVVIRRSRLDLEEIKIYKDDLALQGVSFAKVKDPELLEYDLGNLSDLYVKTLNSIYPQKGLDIPNHFIGARYKPAAYLRPGSSFFEKLAEGTDKESADELRQSILQGQNNVSKFMRTMLVRRFESSVAAFESTLKKMQTSAEQILSWLTERGEVPVYKKADLPEPQDLENMDEEEIDALFDRYEEKGLIRIPATELDPNFERDIRSDIVLLEDLYDQWFSGGEKDDPKFDFFLKTINESLEEDSSRKIIIFTEFSDTANYVYKKLQQNGLTRSFKYSSADSSVGNKRIIRTNFDAGLEKSQQQDDYDLLVATDAISEGFNLHRAGTIINYDIPYNPTRVIQRVGRINRINKKVFEELRIYNFFPTPTGERETKTKSISTLKMNIIHALLGEDTKILTSEEELHNFFAESYRAENAENESLSWDAKHRNLWLNVRAREDLMQQVDNIPLRTRIGRKTKDSNIIVAFGKRGVNHVFAIGEGEDVELVPAEIAMNFFAAEPEEKPLETSINFDPIYQEVKKHLFKNNSHMVVKSGSRRAEAAQRLVYLSSLNSVFSDYCDDVIKLIKDYDALPEGLLKKIANLKINKDDPDESFAALKELVPLDYIADIEATAKRSTEEGDFVLLTEELL